MSYYFRLKTEINNYFKVKNKNYLIHLFTVTTQPYLEKAKNLSLYY